MKIIFSIFLILVLTSFISAFDQSQFDFEYPPTVFDNATATVNTSEIWITGIGNLDTVNDTHFNNNGPGTLTIDQSWLSTFGSTIWCALTGCTMIGNLNMGGNNIIDITKLVIGDASPLGGGLEGDMVIETNGTQMRTTVAGTSKATRSNPYFEWTYFDTQGWGLTNNLVLKASDDSLIFPRSTYIWDTTGTSDGVLTIPDKAVSSQLIKIWTDSALDIGKIESSAQGIEIIAPLGFDIALTPGGNVIFGGLGSLFPAPANFTNTAMFWDDVTITNTDTNAFSIWNDGGIANIFNFDTQDGGEFNMTGDFNVRDAGNVDIFNIDTGNANANINGTLDVVGNTTIYQTSDNDRLTLCGFDDHSTDCGFLNVNQYGTFNFYAYDELKFESDAGSGGAIIFDPAWGYATRFNRVGRGNVTFFSQAPNGKTPEVLISGYRAGDELRTMSIAVGIDAVDTASFNGVGNYLFDGNVNITGKIHNPLSHMYGLATAVHTVPLVDTWYNITMNVSLGGMENINFSDDNITLTLIHDGHYTINFGMGFQCSDNSDVDVGMRIELNDVEMKGSYVEEDMANNQDHDEWLEHTTHFEGSIGDTIRMQYIASNDCISIVQDDTYATQGFSAFGYLQEVIA